MTPGRPAEAGGPGGPDAPGGLGELVGSDERGGPDDLRGLAGVGGSEGLRDLAGPGGPGGPAYPAEPGGSGCLGELVGPEDRGGADDPRGLAYPAEPGAPVDPDAARRGSDAVPRWEGGGLGGVADGGAGAAGSGAGGSWAGAGSGAGLRGCAPDAGVGVEEELARYYARGWGLGVEELGGVVPWEERLARVALTRIADPGDEVIGRALRERGAPATLAAARAGTPLPGAGPRRTAGYAQRAGRARPVADLADAQRAGARFVCPGDGDWPGQLDDLGDQQPYGLWVRGGSSLRLWALRSVAVVGARACTDYGAHMAARIGAGLAEAGWVVVSGAAYGIDGAAHRAALAAPGATIGVVASGIDVAYPRGNAALIHDIAERGLLVGELPPTEHPTRSRFILRNRVIAALTRGTVVIEARHRSGSLITARRATALGRITMGVPGPCTSGLSAGVHELLRNGAALVTDAAEVVELVGEIGADLAPRRCGPVLPRDRLTAATAAVLEALPGHGTATAEDLAPAAGGTPADTLSRLHELHALGFVTRTGGRWALVRTDPTRPPDRTG